MGAEPNMNHLVVFQVLPVLSSPFLILHPTTVKSAEESTFETENIESHAQMVSGQSCFLYR